jgi:hypothetical protein
VTTKIVMAFDPSDPDLAALIYEEIVSKFEMEKETVHVEWAPSQDQAMRALAEECAVLITPLNIREKIMSPLRLDEERGIDLVKWAAENTKAESILVTPGSTAKLDDAQPLDHCQVMTTSCHMVQKIADLARSVVRARPAKCLDIEIQLIRKTLWICNLTCRGFAYSFPSRELTITDDVVNEMEEMSNVLALICSSDASSKAASHILHRLGEKLLNTLSGDKNFQWDILEGLEKAGGEANARISFAVSPDLHGLALEMVLCPRSRTKHWMLEAPVFRRLLADRSSTGSLFERGRNIKNCLVIEAETSGYVGAVEQNLNPLQSVADECSWIENQQTEFNWKIKVIRRDKAAGSVLKRVQDALKDQTWDIIHFAGHSCYDLKSKSGYVFLPGEADGSIEKIDIVQFSGWIRHSNLFYFSSCDSGNGPFMFELANRGIPNMVGFRWSIEDRLAFEYTKKFYKTLHEERSLEKAFLRSRQAMHDSHPESMIWAAPLLIKQFSDS